MKLLEEKTTETTSIPAIQKGKSASSRGKCTPVEDNILDEKR